MLLIRGERGAQRTSRLRATLQPRVPAPKRRHLVDETISRLSDGIRRHRMRRRFRSTDVVASLHGRAWSHTLWGQTPTHALF